MGYSSVKSDLKVSPLFNIRTSRAIDKESKDFIYDYIRMGKESILSIPNRDGLVVVEQQLIEVLYKIKEKRFDRIIDLIIKYIHQREDFQEFEEKDIFQFLNQLKSNPDKIKPHYLNGEENKLSTSFCETYGYYPCITVDFGVIGFIGCILVPLLSNILNLLVWISEFISYILNC